MIKDNRTILSLANAGSLELHLSLFSTPSSDRNLLAASQDTHE